LNCAFSIEVQRKKFLVLLKEKILVVRPEKGFFMKQLTTLLKKLQINKIAIAFCLGAILLLTTACNTGNEVGARPNNPPVQMGGQNNPHKAGGDDYTQYKVPTDKNVIRREDRASIKQPLAIASAAPPVSKDTGDIQYKGLDEPKSLRSKDDFVSPRRQKELNNPGQIPEKKQPIVDRFDPDAKLLEKTGQSFKDASEFVKDDLKKTAK
jgi:hypothetical protein